MGKITKWVIIKNQIFRKMSKMPLLLQKKIVANLFLSKIEILKE